MLLLPFSLLYFFICYISKKVICPPVSEYAEFISDHLKALKFNATQSILDLKPETFTIDSKEGHPLSCRYYNFNKKKTIIMCHGWTSNFCNMLQLIPMFSTLGFNIFLYDQRYHGESGGNCTTFGYYEKEDLKRIVHWVKQTKHPKVIGLYGCSMGSSTIIQYLPLTSDVDFAIVDCPYSDLYDEMTNVIKVACPILPARVILVLANLFFRMKGKFSIKKIRPLKDMENIHIPMLIIHGDKDFFVPTEMSRRLYQAKKDKKHLLIVPDASHGKAYDVNPRLYKRMVFKFLRRYNMI
jgi:hypothetical protein